MKNLNIENTVKQFIKTTNKFDVDSALTLFTNDAIIDDVSVGEKFKNTKGITNYLEKFFVGYKTKTKLISLELVNDKQANAQVDFTGDFGHETGALNFTFTTEGLILKIDAYLD